MTTFEKLSLRLLLSKVPETLNSNFSNLIKLIRKFYSEDKDCIECYAMNVDGIMNADEVDAKQLYIKLNNKTLSINDVLDRIRTLENKKSSNNSNNQNNNNPSDPGYDPEPGPNNPGEDPSNPSDDPSSGGEPIWIPGDDPDPTEYYSNCVTLSQYNNLLKAAYQGVVNYGYNNAIADKMLAEYCRHIKYNNSNARPGSDSWDDVYGTLDNSFLSYMQTNYSEFTNVEVVYLGADTYLDIVHFWAIINGLMYEKGDLPGWGGDVIQLAVDIDNGEVIDSIPGGSFSEIDLITDFEAIDFYENYKNGNYNIDRAFEENFMHYESESTNYNTEELRRITTFVYVKGSSNVETIYEESDSYELLNEWLIDQFNISNNALTTAKSLLQQYINRVLL